MAELFDEYIIASEHVRHKANIMSTNVIAKVSYGRKHLKQGRGHCARLRTYQVDLLVILIQAGDRVPFLTLRLPCLAPP